MAKYVIFLLCAHRARDYIFCAQAQRKHANSSDFSKTADAGIVIAQIEQNVKQYEHNKQMHVTNLHKLNTQTLVAKLKEATDIFLHLSRDPVTLKCKILDIFKFTLIDTKMNL
jgi:hypothetical protein